ncbi:MAG: LPXTG cell wall anchor domain-containing protein [archaeon]
MKIFPIFGIIMILGMAFASACHVDVFVKDSLGNDLEGFNVELNNDCGFSVLSDDTDYHGYASFWSLQHSCTYFASVPQPPEDYVCDSDSSYLIKWGSAFMDLTCEKVSDVPEFSTIGAAFALIGAGFFAAKKKRKN